MAVEQKKFEQIDVVVLDSRGESMLNPQIEKAQQLGLTAEVVIQRFSPEDYQRPYDIEVQAYTEGRIGLGEMTPSYAHAMVWNELKKARTGVRTFTDEIGLAQKWKSRLGELGEAFGLPEDHFSIDTTGDVLHVHPVEVSGETPSQKSDVLEFDLLETDQFPQMVGRGFEAILPTHVQGSGYATPAHPEMDSSLTASWAIPSLKVGKHVRIGGSFNPQGNGKWVFEDNCWLGQGCYFISQEHEADKPAQLARTRSHTSFPGMHVGRWAWVAKQAQILYRTQYIGEGSVIASHSKINTWVSDHSLVSSEGHHAFYPIKSFVLNNLGLTDTEAVLALNWKKVEERWEHQYEEWRSREHKPDENVALAIADTRQQERSRILFLGSKNEANVLTAASREGGKFPARRIDVMTSNQENQAFTMQALNGMRNRSTRFRRVENMGNVPIGTFYEEPLYDLVVIEESAKRCQNGGADICKIFDEARRLVKPDGRIIGTIHDMDSGDGLTLPEYVQVDQTTQISSDTMAIHIQNVMTGDE